MVSYARKWASLADFCPCLFPFFSCRLGSYNPPSLGSGYPPQDMLPSSSSSSAVSSSVGSYKVSRYSEDAQEPLAYHRGRPLYPPASSYRPNEPPSFLPYPNMGGPGPHGPPHHSAMPPPPLASQYEPLPPPLLEREWERDRDSGGRYSGALGSRRSSYHQHESNSSSSKYHSHHSHHHSERRDERGYRRDSLGSRSSDHGHQRHRNHHHSHNHHGGRRRSSHDRDRDRDRDSDYSNNSDPRYSANSYRSSSNSMSPPPSSYSSKDPAPAPPQGVEGSSRMGSSERPPAVSAPGDKDYHHGSRPPPPPPPPPLPPASVIAAAVAETLGSLDFGKDSPAREEPWSKPKRRPSTPPAPPKTPPPSSPPPRPTITSSSSSASPSSTSLPHLLPSSSSSSSTPPLPQQEQQQQRDSSSPEPDSTNESLPFAYHSGSLDSRIEMLLKEQKDKFSFLALDEDEDEERRRARRGGESGEAHQGGVAEGAEPRRGQEEVNVEEGVDTESRKKGERNRGTGLEGRKSPASALPQAPAATPTSHAPLPEEPPPRPSSPLETVATLQKEESQEGVPVNTHGQTGAHTPPYNGQGQVRSHEMTAGSHLCCRNRIGLK